MESVIQVPGSFRKELLQACCEPKRPGLRIHREDCDGWEAPDDRHAEWLERFLTEAYPGAPSRSWRAAVGVRYAFNDDGVFVNADHHKRFFGLCREQASIPLLEAMPEFAEEVGATSSKETDSTYRLLSKLHANIPKISKEVRMEVLRATFKLADQNKNGTLSRAEISRMFRKVVTTLSTFQITEMLEQADKDYDRQINWQEFLSWLEKDAPFNVTSQLERSLNDESDIIKASFRLWDRNGDGVISQKELGSMLHKLCKGHSVEKIKAMIKVIDADHDGNVDYDEFVDFLFKGGNKLAEHK